MVSFSGLSASFRALFFGAVVGRAIVYSSAAPQRCGATRKL
jgi:hypothetical protein